MKADTQKTGFNYLSFMLFFRLTTGLLSIMMVDSLGTNYCDYYEKKCC